MAVGLKYIDEDDKCYGITGMVIGIMVFDAESLISSVSIDEEGDSIKFTGDFITHNNADTIKGVWTIEYEKFKIALGMLIANVMCRNFVLRKSGINNELRNLLLKYMEEEGQNFFSLEKDEIRRLFDKNYDYMQRIFTHAGVQNIVHDFVRNIKSCRTMSKSQVIENLQALSML